MLVGMQIFNTFGLGSTPGAYPVPFKARVIPGNSNVFDLFTAAGKVRVSQQIAIGIEILVSLFKRRLRMGGVSDPS
jgi:hypothetical protein